MDYEIIVSVKEVTSGEEIYKRQVALPEQVPMLRQDIEAAIDVYEDKQLDYALDQGEEREKYYIREEGE